MSTDLLLDQNQDLVVELGDLQLVTEGEEVIQCAKIRILHILGEWIFDYTKGVDWFGVMWATDSSTLQKKTEIQRTLVNTPNLRRLLRLDFAVDPVEHAAQIDFTADSVFGPVSTDLTI